MKIQCTILVDRLNHFITKRDVCNYIHLPFFNLRKVANVVGSNEWKDEHDRDEAYHLSKLKYLIDNGIDKPIDVDNISIKGKNLPHPVIIDGRHRYLAALLRRDKTIECTYSGREDLLKYLTGETKIPPRVGE